MEQMPAGRRESIARFIRRPLVIGVIVLAIVVVILLVVFLRSRPREYVSASGIIEATEVTLSSKVNARVTRVSASEGDHVSKGEILVRLRDVEFREQIRQAEAALATARARLSEAVAGARPEEIRQARAQVEQAEATVAGARRTLRLAEENFEESRELRARLEAARANYNSLVAAYQQALAQDERAREDLRRAEVLYQRGAIPANQLDAARAAARTAEAQVEQSRAIMEGARRDLEIAEERYRERLQERQQLTAARTQYDTAQAQLRAAEARLQEFLAGTRSEQIEQLRAQVRQAEAALAQARVQLENTTIESPIDGTVITRAVEPGELATVGSTLIVLADLSEVWLRIYIEEPVYGRIRLGQSAAVTVDSYPGEVFRGRVTEIADEAEFTPKEIQTEEERAKLVFGVKITIPNPDGKLKPGMPADSILRLQPVAARR